MSNYGGRGGSTGYASSRRTEEYGDEPSVDMYVPAEDCGRIIGRGGTKIRDLQDSSGCRIKVHRDDDGNGTRRVQLTGSEGNIAEAREMINQILESDDRRGGGGGGGGAGGAGGANTIKDVMQIDSNFVGRVIGKQGSKVRELQDSTGCRINVSRDPNGSLTDVELIGSRISIQRARDAIDDITSQVY